MASLSLICLIERRCVYALSPKLNELCPQSALPFDYFGCPKKQGSSKRYAIILCINQISVSKSDAKMNFWMCKYIITHRCANAFGNRHHRFSLVPVLYDVVGCFSPKKCVEIVCIFKRCSAVYCWTKSMLLFQLCWVWETNSSDLYLRGTHKLP